MDRRNFPAGIAGLAFAVLASAALATVVRPMPASAQTCSMPWSTPTAWSAGVVITSTSRMPASISTLIG